MTNVRPGVQGRKVEADDETGKAGKFYCSNISDQLARDSDHKGRRAENVDLDQSSELDIDEGGGETYPERPSSTRSLSEYSKVHPRTETHKYQAETLTNA
ncbi:hypothetical protein GALMADRAFT_232645 [Galerina marginata CBS 339.88]|uniref:Uncharacterized protein n=1 Tax=Galerina marginata (strain CBS 339.88) TaxID=685588 RepID=A0A067S624_GALM3|nr:hypothetical protein GALMADRAFT_232645 [Galerina marginata CBS 339.88]